MNVRPDVKTTPNASQSYWGMVWQQFSRSRASMLGLFFVGLMFAVAFLAPVLAEKKPLIWIEDGVTTFPLIREFFAPSEAPERVLETGYNFLLLFFPSMILIWWLTGKYQVKKLRKWLLLVVAILLLIPFFAVQTRLNTTPYRQLAAEGQGEGVFPLIPYGPFEQGFGNRIPPTWWSESRAEGENTTYHVLGTDNAGRDVLVRIIHGARVSLAVGIVSVFVATAIGIFIGAIAGYFGGRIDILLSRAIEIMMCFPTFFLILTIIAIMDERSILNIVLVIGCTSWTGVARLVRGEVLKQRGLDYVTASIALGASSLRTIFRHLLPNSIAPVLVSITFGIASSILMESGLSFLGFGVDIPTASWGELLKQAREAPTIYWWLVMFPGAPIFFTVTIYNLVGEGLRDAMDPRLRLQI
ncbi:MAG: ABC transporter permease [Planctomycetes bacterium]|nr:ABC transporter permease [Planctomycetota bacterium]